MKAATTVITQSRDATYTYTRHLHTYTPTRSSLVREPGHSRRDMPGDNENTAMPAGSTIITVINEMTGSIVDQLNNPGRATSEIDAKSLASADAIRLRVHKRVPWDWEIFCALVETG